MARNLGDGGMARLTKRRGPFLPRSVPSDGRGAEAGNSGSSSSHNGQHGAVLLRPRTRTAEGTRNGPSIRSVVRISLAVAGTALALYLLYLIRSVLQLVVLALFVALALGPLVGFLARRRVSRTPAIALAYLALLGLIVFLGLVAIPRSSARSTPAPVNCRPPSESSTRTRRSTSTTRSTRSLPSWRPKLESSPVSSRASPKASPR